MNATFKPLGTPVYNPLVCENCLFDNTLRNAQTPEENENLDTLIKKQIDRHRKIAQANAVKNTIQFPSFRAAAEFYSNSGFSYDDACKVVRCLIADGKLVIKKTKTDFSALLEVVFFIVSTFVLLGLSVVLMAWVQIDTAALREFFAVMAIATMSAWLYFSIVTTKIFLCGSSRRI